MSQLEPIELGEFCKVDSGFAFKSEQFSDDCNDVFLIKGSNLGHRQIKWDEGPWWNVDDYKKFERYQLREQDVLLAMDRPIVGGQLKYSWIKEGDPKALLVQRVARLRAIEPEDQKFLRYVIASPAFLQYIDTITTGVNVPHISGPDIRKYKFNLPKKSARLKIAEVIDAYDDLIENNLKRIKLLEEMAQITYEEWFVRMKFPGHETAVFDEETGLPEDWTTVNLSDYINIEHGYAYQGEYFSDFETSQVLLTPGNFKIGGGIKLDKFKYYDEEAESPKKYILSKHDLLVTMTDLSKMADTLGYPLLVPSSSSKTYLHNQRLGKVVSNTGNKLPRYFLYMLFQDERYRAFVVGSATGATVKHSSPSKILAYKPKLPSLDNDLVISYDSFARPVFESIDNLLRENGLLKEARDILLPRLMTGMIDIEQVELPEAMLKRLEQQENKMATAV